MPRRLFHTAAVTLLIVMCLLSGGAARRESATVDEVTHIASGLSYVQRLDLRLNPEHPPLGKFLAGIPLALRGVRADYSSPAWTLSNEFTSAFSAQWVFGDAVLGRWNDWRPVVFWARIPMLILTLVLGWVMYHYGSLLGGSWGGLLSLAAYVTAPVFLAFGPLVITDVPVTLFTLIALWRLGEIRANPTPRNALWFGLATGAAMLAKFTGVLIVVTVFALAIQARFWPGTARAKDPAGHKAWRKAQWRCAWRGIFWAALVVYVGYLVLSWNQPDDALDRLGSGSWAWLIRRPLMPVWIYLRGFAMMIFMGSRPTFLLGQSYPHGVPQYFPIAFLLKSTPGFLLLLLTAGIAGWNAHRSGEALIPERLRPHWRVLVTGFFVFLAACLLSRLDISIRHFMMPITLLTLMLATLPRALATMPGRRALQALVVVLAASCFWTAVREYPYYIPYVNALSFGRPVYYLLNDSNVGWNESLPELAQFAQEQHLQDVPLDWLSLSDPALIVPQARPWDCQQPTAGEAGRWVAVSAVMILENHNCGYLREYPRRTLGGGAIYLFQLPSQLPQAGTPGGPPLPQDQRVMLGLPVDIRAWSINVERHPEQLRDELPVLMRKFQEQRK